MPSNYRHQSALLGKLLHHHTPETSAECVNSGLLRVRQKDVDRNPQRPRPGKQVLPRARQLPRLTAAGTQALGRNPGSATY